MGANSQAWNSALSGLGSSFEKVSSMNRQREQDRIAEEERARKTEHENAERAYIEEQRRKGEELAAAKEANTKAYYDKLAELKSKGVQEEVKSETSSDYANAMGLTAPKHTRVRTATEDDYLGAAIEHQQLGGMESEALARYFLNGKKVEQAGQKADISKARQEEMERHNKAMEGYRAKALELQKRGQDLRAAKPQNEYNAEWVANQEKELENAQAQLRSMNNIKGMMGTYADEGEYQTLVKEIDRLKAEISNEKKKKPSVPATADSAAALFGQAGFAK